MASPLLTQHNIKENESEIHPVFFSTIQREIKGGEHTTFSLRGRIFRFFLAER